MTATQGTIGHSETMRILFPSSAMFLDEELRGMYEPWKYTITEKFFQGRLLMGFLIKALQ